MPVFFFFFVQLFFVLSLSSLRSGYLAAEALPHAHELVMYLSYVQHCFGPIAVHRGPLPAPGARLEGSLSLFPSVGCGYVWTCAGFPPPGRAKLPFSGAAIEEPRYAAALR